MRQESLAEIKVRLEAVYADRLREVVLSGSEARGMAGPDSDIGSLSALPGCEEGRNSLMSLWAGGDPAPARYG